MAIILKQWAQKVIKFSSQYNSTGWSADQILGPPKVYPKYGDIQGAWASELVDSFQFIELEFEKAVVPESINIYETYNSGGTVAIKAMNPFHKWEILWKTNTPENFTESRIFAPEIKGVKFATKRIRIDVDCTGAGAWCEIDAVELVGQEISGEEDTSYIRDMGSLVNNPLFSDVKLILDGQHVYAHKSILSARSRYFSTLLEHHFSDSIEIDLSVSFDDLLAILSFIYTNQLPQDCHINSVITLYEVSSTLVMPSMKMCASNKMISLITCENVVVTYMKIHKETIFDEITEYCLKFMVAHLKSMTSIPNFKTLPQSVLIKVIQEATEHMNLNEAN